MFAEIIDIYIAKHSSEIDKMREADNSVSLLQTRRQAHENEIALRNTFLADLRTLRECAAILERDGT